MNRLRDESGWDALSERGIALLRRVPASSTRSDLKRRVWTGLQEISARDAFEPHHARLKGFVLGVAVVASAATAGAAIGGRWIAPRLDRVAVADAAPRADAKPRHRRATVRRVAEASEPSAISPPAPAAAAAAEPPPATEARAPSRLAHHAVPAAADPRTEVLDALVALRRDHDAERAAGLLDRYLGANRHGALREEALALAIEAADSRGNPAEARRLARVYLVDFPRGRFAPFASQHVGAGN